MAGNSQRKLRILHTADVHMESLGDKACHSFEVLVDLAIKTKVDLVMIAGDLFDHNRVKDELVGFVAEQLRRLPVDVVILPGNHDCLIPDSVFNRAEFWNKSTNVQVFRAPHGETLDLPGLGVLIWGKAIDSYEGDLQPLAGIPRPQRTGRWHIAMAHGYYVGSKAPSFPSLQITQEELVSSGWDYIALGHLPVFRCVCDGPVKAYYCGTPSSLSSTVAIVDLADKTGIQVSCCSLQDRKII